MSRKLETELISGLGDEERFLLRVAAELDASLETLTTQELARLDAIRRGALQTADVPAVLPPRATSEQAKSLLADSAAQIPEEIRQQLDGIRARAMLKARAAQRESLATSLGQWLRLPRQFAVPAGAFASVSVLITTLALFTPSDTPEVLPVALSEDGMLIASAEELELYQNLEFYQWLVDNGLQN